MARTLATLPEGSRITDYVSLGVITKTFPLFPPVQRKAFHERVIEEILQERLACRRSRRNPRGVKRKMSNWPLCRSRSTPQQPVTISQAIRIVK